MRSGVRNDSRHGNPLRRDIFQIAIGIAVAAFLVQADRTISAFEGTTPNAVVNADAVDVGFQAIRLECGRAVAALRRLVRVD